MGNPSLALVLGPLDISIGYAVSYVLSNTFLCISSL